jgi:hypothetical protein
MFQIAAYKSASSSHSVTYGAVLETVVTDVTDRSSGLLRMQKINAREHWEMKEVI